MSNFTTKSVRPPTPPFTIYAVALVYAVTGRTWAFCEMDVVSGDHPLTEAEAVARARASAEGRAGVDEDGVPLSRYTFVNGTMSCVIFR